MRTLLVFVALVGLAGCGGIGGSAGSSASAVQPQRGGTSVSYQAAIVWDAGGGSTYSAPSATYTQWRDLDGNVHAFNGTVNLTTSPIILESGNAPSGSGGNAVQAAAFGMHMKDDTTTPYPAIGIGAYRMLGTYTRWLDIEPVRGTYDWTTLDAYINWAETHGLDIVYTFSNPPQWACGGCDSLVNGPATIDVTAWDEFVTAVARHAAGRIRYWELWNEPNQPFYWQGSVADMVTLAQHAYQDIKLADPFAVVLSPSPATPGSNADPGNWLGTYFAAGGGQYTDVVAFHGYLYNNDPQPEHVTEITSPIVAQMSSNGLVGKPLWNTEASWGGVLNSSMTDSVDGQAFLARSYIVQLSSGVQRFYWYMYDAYVPGNAWGTLYDPSGGMHITGTAFGEVSRWLSGATLAACNSSGTVWTCAVTR